MSDFIVQAANDNVGIAIHDLDAGKKVEGRAFREGTALSVELQTSIPTGHKLALIDLAVGASVFRNGVDIGVLTEAVSKGSLVHTHNLKTRRW